MPKKQHILLTNRIAVDIITENYKTRKVITQMDSCDCSPSMLMIFLVGIPMPILRE